jgi:hypothetical protein
MTTRTGWPEPAAVGYVPTAPACSDHEVVELQLLLPRWQATALEAAARSRGMTTGQILRRVITDLFVEAPPVHR